MKTPAEILMAERTIRLERERKDKQWTKLIASCRAAGWAAPFWCQLSGLILFTGILQRYRPASDRNPYLIAAVAISWSVTTYFSQRRGRRAMLAVIAREAPELHRKLQQEGVAWGK